MGVLGGVISAISKPTSAWEVLLVGRYGTGSVRYTACSDVEPEPVKKLRSGSGLLLFGLGVL